MPLKEFQEIKQRLDAIESSLNLNHYKNDRQRRIAFRDESRVLFQDHPLLKDFSWVQASDPDCEYEFVVNKYGMKVNGLPFTSLEKNDSYFNQLISAYKDVAEFLELFSDDDFLQMFGNHVEIYVTNEDIRISYFDIEQSPITE